jgi:iron(III) transport system ATP-binding protein
MPGWDDQYVRMWSKTMARPYLQVANIWKKFGDCVALEGVNFSVDQGEFLSILGPSGCGKTTILRVIAGLEIQDEGDVFIARRNVSKINISDRNIGIVFQSYALFPNLTAAENIGYGLRAQKIKKKKVAAKVKELLEQVGLSGLGDKYPAQLSGGQQQRVALARAMALEPHILLLDEPLSALDAKVRVHLRSEIRDLQKKMGITTIMVTHDQEEALTMADRILVMDDGRVVQNGTPNEIYDNPVSPFIASFIGSMNFLHGFDWLCQSRYRKGDFILRVNGHSGPDRKSGAVLAIRPEDVVVNIAGKTCENSATAVIETIEYRGSLYRTVMRKDLGNSNWLRLEADVPAERIRRMDLKIEQEVHVVLPPERLHLYSV